MNRDSNATLHPEPSVYRNNQDTEYETGGLMDDKMLFCKLAWHILSPLFICSRYITLAGRLIELIDRKCKA